MISNSKQIQTQKRRKQDKYSKPRVEPGMAIGKPECECGGGTGMGKYWLCIYMMENGLPLARCATQACRF